MFVGGEFYYDQRWTVETPSISSENMYFLNGGAACLTVISDYLRDHGVDRVLLPEYLCPSILTTFERGGITWEFYPINEDFSIDLDALAEKLAGFKAVYLINYFGFLHSPEVRDFFQQVEQNGVLVIEDNAQAGFHDHPVGDFVLNSLRKLAPYDGGYLISQQDMTPYINKYANCPNLRLPLIREYRENLYHYLHEGTGSHAALEELFQRATSHYETDVVVLGDVGERRQIERLDWNAIREVRRENYNYMLEWIESIPKIKPIFPTLQDDNMPFGMPVYFSKGTLRNAVYEELGKASISLMIHWEDIITDPRVNQNHRAVDMAKRMLTLPIDQRISHKQMDYLALNLINAISAV